LKQIGLISDSVIKLQIRFTDENMEVANDGATNTSFGYYLGAELELWCGNRCKNENFPFDHITLSPISIKKGDISNADIMIPTCKNASLCCNVNG
jgi:hypothetical protein